MIFLLELIWAKLMVFVFPIFLLKQICLILSENSSYLPLQAEGKKRISVAAGQSMYTPGDITKSEFTQNDFLYAE